MSQILGIDPDAVVGKLIRFWIWCDAQTISGNALSVTESVIDRITYQSGFSAALRDVGWLEVRSGSLQVPHFDRHNGQTAKARALTNRRVSDHRKACNAPRVTPVTPPPLQKALPEKRREEIDKDSLRSSSSPAPPAGESEGADGELLLGSPPSAMAEPAPTPPPKRPPRPRDPLFDALASVDGSDPLEVQGKAARTIGVALAEIRRATPDVTPAEIARRAALWSAHFPQATMTPSAIAKWWARLSHGPLPASTGAYEALKEADRNRTKGGF